MGGYAMQKRKEVTLVKTVSYLACDHCGAEIKGKDFISISRESFFYTSVPCPDGVVGCLVLHYEDNPRRGESVDMFVYCNMEHLEAHDRSTP